MKKSAQVAYEGLLTAFSVVILWLASAMPAISFAGCICAGLLPAVVISKKRFKAGVIVYTATLFLSLIIVPSKRYVFAYALFFGVYPLVKYAIEQVNNLPIEWILKIIYATFLAFALYVVIRLGLVTINSKLSARPFFFLVVAFFSGFIIYDIIFSKMIALFNMFFKR